MDKVLIFGASSSLAIAAANELSNNHSCEVRLVGHKEEFKTTSPHIQSAGCCDITNWAEVNRVFRNCVDNGFTPTSVINCVGVSGQCPITEMTYNEWRRVVGVNLDGAFNICQNAITFMKESPSPSSIILVGSAYGERHVPHLAHYCVSKSAITALVKALSVEIAKYGIAINAVIPALFPSKMTNAFLADEQYISQLKKHYPAEKLIDPDAIIQAIVFLIKEKTLSINGTEIIVDGGFLNMVEGGIV